MLLLFAIACADFGRIAGHAEIVGNAARLGAEVGARRKFTDATQAAWTQYVREAIETEMGNLSDFDSNSVEIEIDTSTDSDGLRLVSIEVMYPFKTSVAWPAIPNQVNVRRRFVFRQFR